MRGAARLAAGTLLCMPLAASGAEVALSFSEAPGGVSAGFRIERRESGNEHFAPIALVGPGVSDFVDRGLPRDSTYCYRVRSLATRDAAGWSPEVCAVAEDPAPLAPEGGPAPPGVAAAEGTPPPAGDAGASTTPASEPPPPRSPKPHRIRTSGGWLQVLD
jgi:hypothetical protein